MSDLIRDAAEVLKNRILSAAKIRAILYSTLAPLATERKQLRNKVKYADTIIGMISDDDCRCMVCRTIRDTAEEARAASEAKGD